MMYCSSVKIFISNEYWNVIVIVNKKTQFWRCILIQNWQHCSSFYEMKTGLAAISLPHGYIYIILLHMIWEIWEINFQAPFFSHDTLLTPLIPMYNVQNKQLSDQLQFISSELLQMTLGNSSVDVMVCKIKNFGAG